MKTTPTPPTQANAPASSSSTTTTSTPRVSPQVRVGGPSAGGSSPALPPALAGARVSQAEAPSSWFRTLARAAATFANDLEDMLFPVHLLRACGAQPLTPARPACGDGKSVTAAPEVRRGGAAVAARKQLATWCAKNPAAALGDRAALFTDAKTQGLRDTVARVIHADCGETLRAIAHRCVAAVAGPAKAAAAKNRPLSKGALQNLLVQAFRAGFGEVAQKGIGSPELWKFMLDVSTQVRKWESRTGRGDMAADHVVPNLLMAAGLAAAARDLAASASPAERRLYDTLVELTPALAGATHVMEDPTVEMQAALEVTHASSDVMAYCARLLVAADVEERRKLGDSKAQGGARPEAAAGQPGRPGTPSTTLEHPEPSRTDFLTSAAAELDD